MIFSHPTLIKCPTCGSPMEKQGLASGNLFKATHYTDGKIEAPMLPDFPQISICPICENFFWLEEAEVADPEILTSLQVGDRYPSPVRFLYILEYYQALEKNLHRNREDERYLRTQIWWQFNDRVRAGKSLLKSALEEKVWKDNLTALVAILDSRDGEQGILKAEALRNLGLFQQAIQEIANVKDAGLTLTGDTIRLACEQQRSEVMKIVPMAATKPSSNTWYDWAKRKWNWA